MQCTAHSKRTKEPCHAHAVTGRSTCRMHGGRGARGLASPEWKHGRYSKALPANLSAAYERARTDGDLIALRDELALVDARLTALLTELTAGGHATAWETLGSAWRALEAAQAALAAQARAAAGGEEDTG